METKNSPIEKNNDFLIDSWKNQGMIKTEAKNEQSK
jgi:hypothetical protein